MSNKSRVRRLERLVESKGLKRESPSAGDDYNDWASVTDEQLDRAIAQMRAGKPVTDAAVKSALNADRVQWSWVKELPEHVLDKMVENLEFACDLQQATRP